MKIFWEQDHNISTDTWLRQFETKEIPEFQHLGGDSIYKIGAKFLLMSGKDVWLSAWTSGRRGSSWTLTRVVDIEKLMNKGYAYWEFIYESWQKTGFYYRFEVDERYLELKSDEDKFRPQEGALVIVNGKLNVVSTFYKVKTDEMARGYLPGHTSVGRNITKTGNPREDEEAAIMSILSGQGQKRYECEVFKDTAVRMNILRDIHLQTLGI